MDQTFSVSKGIFVFKNGFKSNVKRKSLKRSSYQTSSNLFNDTLWYKSYKQLWDYIENEILKLNDKMFSELLVNLITFLKTSYDQPVDEVPTAALLTGINMPDHAIQFETLTREIKSKITPHVAILRGEDCTNLKYLMESMINQFMSNETELSDEENENDTRIKKSQCSFDTLQDWYESLYALENLTLNSPKKLKSKVRGKVLVVIIEDFESFQDSVLQQLILIVSSYINVLPFVFVFGVATSLAVLHRSLPFHVSSKVMIQVFHSQPSLDYLNRVIEDILFSDDCPFRLGGKVFNLFTDIFLFYDLSVNRFIQNFKYAMLEHFYHGNIMALCSNENVNEIITKFDNSDFESARKLLSVRKWLEESKDKHDPLISNNHNFRSILIKEIENIRVYTKNFHLFLKCLNILVRDLPKAPLGKQLRELYAICTSQHVVNSPEYKESIQLLHFQSKDEFIIKISNIIDLITTKKVITEQLQFYLQKFDNLDIESDEEIMEIEDTPLTGQMNRKQLKEKLLKLSKKAKPKNKFDALKKDILTYLTEVFKDYLRPPYELCLHELFFFDDLTIKNHVIGAQRAAIHTALNDPQYYLQCECCKISDDTIMETMPDISIIYKIHLEYGKLINLYDWLQAYISIIDKDEDDDSDTRRVVKPELQARFTQAVAELELLGFIKSSKKKTDHVTRLTWGG